MQLVNLFLSATRKIQTFAEPLLVQTLPCIRRRRCACRTWNSEHRCSRRSGHPNKILYSQCGYRHHNCVRTNSRCHHHYATSGTAQLRCFFWHRGGVTILRPTEATAVGSVTEVDINFNNTAGNFHVFEPNVSAGFACTIVAAATTPMNADASAGRFTVELEYSLF